MTFFRLTLAALAGTALGASPVVSEKVRAPAPPAATAVVVQLPDDACRPARRPAPSSGGHDHVAERAHTHRPSADVPAAARRLATTGAKLQVVCSAVDATAAVLRAAAEHTAVLGSGPDVRAALALAAADHPAQRFGPLGLTPPRGSPGRVR